MAKILVIEDEEHIQELVKANLTASGYQVLTTGNGEDGLELAKAEYPDLILLDLRLPGMSGWDVFMLLRAEDKFRNIPVIIMTATVPQNHDSRLPGMKTAGYLLKPFEVDELLQKVKQVLGE